MLIDVNNLPRGLAWTKKYKNAIVQKPKTVKIRLYNKVSKFNLHSNSGKCGFVYAAEEYLYLTTMSYNGFKGQSLSANVNPAIKFSVKNGKLKLSVKTNTAFLTINNRDLCHIFAKSKVFASRFETVFKIWLKHNGLTYKTRLGTHKIGSPVGRILFNIKRLAYPILDTLHNSALEVSAGINSLPPEITKYYTSHKTFKENQFFDYFFGTHGKNLKKVVKEKLRQNHAYSTIVDNADLRWYAKALITGRVLKNLVSYDTLVHFVQQGFQLFYGIGDVQNSAAKIKSTRLALSRFTKEQRDYLLQSVKTIQQSHLLLDSLRVLGEMQGCNFVYEGFTPNGLLNVEQVHEAVFPARVRWQEQVGATFRPISIEENQELKVANFLRGQTDMQVGLFRLEVPKDTDTLREWGKIMHNCVGSYGHVINAGHIAVLGVFLEDKLVYNIAISVSSDGNRSLQQFYGVCNQAPDVTHKAQIKQFLIDKRFILELF